jgi:hypothetical protein
MREHRCLGIYIRHERKLGWQRRRCQVNTAAVPSPYLFGHDGVENSFHNQFAALRPFLSTSELETGGRDKSHDLPKECCPAIRIPFDSSSETVMRVRLRGPVRQIASG